MLCAVRKNVFQNEIGFFILENEMSVMELLLKQNASSSLYSFNENVSLLLNELFSTYIKFNTAL
jgi:hypothetical protein